MERPLLGVDVVEIRRFRGAGNAISLKKLFTERELLYCGAFKDAAPHFAATFAAKEAACKALGGARPPTYFEVRRGARGKPEIWDKRKKLSRLSISLAHEGKYAVAVCLAL